MERGVYWYDGTWDVYFSKPLDPPPGDRVGMAAVGIKHELVYNGVPQSGMDLDDPTFGSGTDAAIRKFQQSHGLTVDGSVGPNTAKSLFRKRGQAEAARIGCPKTLLCQQFDLESACDPACLSDPARASARAAAAISTRPTCSSARSADGRFTGWKMYLDHQSPRRRRRRPAACRARSVTSAAIIKEAWWDPNVPADPQTGHGQGAVVGLAKPNRFMRSLIEDCPRPSARRSRRRRPASGRSAGQGQPVWLVEGIRPRGSVDWVTEAGAGGGSSRSWSRSRSRHRTTTRRSGC
jgi:hypothetical protein